MQAQLYGEIFVEYFQKLFSTVQERFFIVVSDSSVLLVTEKIRLQSTRGTAFFSNQETSSGNETTKKIHLKIENVNETLKSHPFNFFE